MSKASSHSVMDQTHPPTPSTTNCQQKAGDGIIMDERCQLVLTPVLMACQQCFKYVSSTYYNHCHTEICCFSSHLGGWQTQIASHIRLLTFLSAEAKEWDMETTPVLIPSPVHWPHCRGSKQSDCFGERLRDREVGGTCWFLADCTCDAMIWTSKRS